MNLKDHFPRASQSFIEANASGPVQGNVERNSGIAKVMTNPHYANEPRRGRMNKTEAEFALILEAMKKKGEILRYEFEGITLRFANVRYTPDFVVFVDDFGHQYENPHVFVKCIEVKGPFIRGNRERAVERFRHAKTFWPEFTFELHQRTKEGWKQLI